MSHIETYPVISADMSTAKKYFDAGNVRFGLQLFEPPTCAHLLYRLASYILAPDSGGSTPDVEAATGASTNSVRAFWVHPQVAKRYSLGDVQASKASIEAVLRDAYQPRIPVTAITEADTGDREFVLTNEGRGELIPVSDRGEHYHLAMYFQIDTATQDESALDNQWRATIEWAKLADAPRSETP